jgi:hypothetical protein
MSYLTTARNQHEQELEKAITQAARWRGVTGHPVHIRP